MSLSLDVTASGLDAGQSYLNDVGSPPPTVDLVNDGTRWGFAIADDSGVSIPQQGLTDAFFDSSAFTLSLAFKATDGVQSAGEILRIHKSLELRINSDGTVQSKFFNDQDAKFILRSGPTNALDGQWHDLKLTYDGGKNLLQLDLDSATVASMAAAGITKPMQSWGLNLGAVWNIVGFEGLIDDVYVDNTIGGTTPPTSPPTLPPSSGSTLSVDFSSPTPPNFLDLLGDAQISANQTLSLDGKGDYALLQSPASWDGATAFYGTFDFRFSDPTDLDTARPFFNQALGFDVTNNSVSAIVSTSNGLVRNWIGGQHFDDLQWHTIEFAADASANTLVVSVDGQTVIDRADLDVKLPTNFADSYLGGMAWGRYLQGEVDNVVLSTQPLNSQPGTVGPGVGNADPALAMNTQGFVDWGQYSTAAFIDRMKGAHAWTGAYKNYFSSSGSVHVFNDLSVFDSNSAIQNIAFASDTLLNINRIATVARFGSNVITAAEYQAIMANPNTYFKIQVGSSGNSELLGRLHKSDPFHVMARFDENIGMTLNELRNAGQAYVTDNDRALGFRGLTLDENGWPTHLPVDIVGGEGDVSAIVLWYPSAAANAPNSIYSGNFYLMVDGEGTFSLTQSGSGPGRVYMTDITVDGPTMVPFTYTPNGSQLTLRISETDPHNTGEYLRNIKIVHEDHLDLLEAGEIFTPEFVNFHEEHRAIRWMNAQQATSTPAWAAGDFTDAPTLDDYTFNLGSSKVTTNGFPIEAIVEFSNKTGTDPWINIPINASDAYVLGMADYIEQHLDPRLKVYVELGNENWNAVFDTNKYAKAEGLAYFGDLVLKTAGQGQFVLDANGKPIIVSDGYFFRPDLAQKNGYATLDELAQDLGLTHDLVPRDRAWSEWTSMRATQVGKIFNDVFQNADPATADERVVNVLANQSVSPNRTDQLLQADLWHTTEPGAWIDPDTVFDAVAIGAYFGGTTGSQDSDLVNYWLTTYGKQQTIDLTLRHLKADLDPSVRMISFDGSDIDQGGHVIAGKMVSNVHYAPDLIIDVFDAIHDENANVRLKINNGQGISQGIEVLVGQDVHNYVRLVTGASGKTELQLRVDPANGQYETVVAFDSVINKSIDQMLAEGTLFVRTLNSLEDEALSRFPQQKAVADAHGLDFLSYEGGQHFAAAIWGPYRPNLNNANLTNFLTDMNKIPEIAELYDLWFDAWKAAGGGMFTHYADYASASRFGSWGALEYLGEENVAGAPTYKYDFLEALSDDPPWWTESRAPGTFLQGVVDRGTAADDQLIGTVEEDILIGNGGDDLLVSGAGDDALIGGSGIDTVNAGAGDDVITISDVADTIDGGAGLDVVKIDRTLSSLDLSTLHATNVETLDLRNYAETVIALDDMEVFAMNASHALTILAETADDFTITGMSFQGKTIGEHGSAYHYHSTVQGQAVSLDIVFDIDAPTNITLFA
jgi:hypothetical protein